MDGWMDGWMDGCTHTLLDGENSFSCLIAFWRREHEYDLTPSQIKTVARVTFPCLPTNCLLLQADAGKAYKADADLPFKVAEALLQ